MTKRISIFILVSVSAHAAVLGLIGFDAQLPRTPGAPMQVSIQASKANLPESPPPVTKSQPEPLPHKAKAKPETKNILPALAIKTTITTTKVKVFTSTADAKASLSENVISKLTTEISKPENKKPTSIHRQIVNDEPKKQKTASLTELSEKKQASEAKQARTASLLQSSLQQAFALNFHYPRLAQRRGWQGEVQLSLRIKANGELSKIQVLHSSGHQVLDEAAMESLHDVKRLPQAVALLQGISMDLILPVIYKLL